MADFESKFRYDSDFSKVTADIKKLVREATAANAVFAQLNKSAASAKMQAAQTFASQAGFAGFKTQIVDLTGATEQFGQQLMKNKLTMKEYFSEAARAYKKDSKARALAEREVRRAQSTVVGLGDIGGQRKGLLVTPQSLDMSKANVQLQMATKQYEIFNDLVNKGSTALVNWGKNTQWAGRQLTVGLTVPMTIFTGQALKAFAGLDQEITRFRKVYGSDLTGTVGDATDQMVAQIRGLGSEFAKQYGIASKETMALAADLAAAGLEGENLANAVNQTTRMIVLGEVDRQEAMKATLSIQTAFNQSSRELAKSVDFLNAVENQTSASLQDLVEAIPKTGPVIQALGGDIKDLSVLMTAMREGGINAAEGANALKSGMASLISPTTKAIEVSRQFGIDLQGIVTRNKGQLMPLLLDFQKSLRNLDDFGKAQVIEEIFGKYQFARISALFDNLNAQGSQTVGMVKLLKASADDLAKKSYSELKAQENAPSTRLAAMQQQLQEQLIKVGADLAETLLPIMQKGLDILSAIVDGFNNLPGPIKSFAKILGGITVAAGPLLMLAGIFGNLIGNAIKFGMSIVNMFKRVTGHPVKTLQILSDEELAAKLAANQLTGAYDRQRTSVMELNAALDIYIANLREAAAIAPPGAVRPGGRGPRPPMPPIRRKDGGVIFAQNGVDSGGRINGYGGGDTVPALLEPGEFVINKQSSAKHSNLLRDINAGKDIPGYELGTPDGVGDVFKGPITSKKSFGVSGGVLGGQYQSGGTTQRLGSTSGTAMELQAAVMANDILNAIEAQASGSELEAVKQFARDIRPALLNIQEEFPQRIVRINDERGFTAISSELKALADAAPKGKAGDSARQRYIAFQEAISSPDGRETKIAQALGMSEDVVSDYIKSKAIEQVRPVSRLNAITVPAGLDPKLTKMLESLDMFAELANAHTPIGGGQSAFNASHEAASYRQYQTVTDLAVAVPEYIATTGMDSGSLNKILNTLGGAGGIVYVKDENGKQIMVDTLDENGNPVLDKKGNPVQEKLTRPQTVEDRRALTAPKIARLAELGFSPFEIDKALNMLTGTAAPVSWEDTMFAKKILDTISSDETMLKTFNATRGANATQLGEARDSLRIFESWGQEKFANWRVNSTIAGVVNATTPTQQAQAFRARNQVELYDFIEKKLTPAYQELVLGTNNTEAIQEFKISKAEEITRLQLMSEEFMNNMIEHDIEMSAKGAQLLDVHGNVVPKRNGRHFNPESGRAVKKRSGGFPKNTKELAHLRETLPPRERLNGTGPWGRYMTYRFPNGAVVRGFVKGLQTGGPVLPTGTSIQNGILHAAGGYFGQGAGYRARSWMNPMNKVRRPGMGGDAFRFMGQQIEGALGKSTKGSMSGVYQLGNKKFYVKTFDDEISALAEVASNRILAKMFPNVTFPKSRIGKIGESNQLAAISEMINTKTLEQLTTRNQYGSVGNISEQSAIDAMLAQSVAGGRDMSPGNLLAEGISLGDARAVHIDPSEAFIKTLASGKPAQTPAQLVDPVQRALANFGVIKGGARRFGRDTVSGFGIGAERADVLMRRTLEQALSVPDDTLRYEIGQAFTGLPKRTRRAADAWAKQMGGTSFEEFIIKRAKDNAAAVLGQTKQLASGIGVKSPGMSVTTGLQIRNQAQHDALIAGVSQLTIGRKLDEMASTAMRPMSNPSVGYNKAVINKPIEDARRMATELAKAEIRTAHDRVYYRAIAVDDETLASFKVGSRIPLQKDGTVASVSQLDGPALNAAKIQARMGKGNNIVMLKIHTKAGTRLIDLDAHAGGLSIPDFGVIGELEALMVNGNGNIRKIHSGVGITNLEIDDFRTTGLNPSWMVPMQKFAFGGQVASYKNLLAHRTKQEERPKGYALGGYIPGITGPRLDSIRKMTQRGGGLSQYEKLMQLKSIMPEFNAFKNGTATPAMIERLKKDPNIGWIVKELDSIESVRSSTAMRGGKAQRLQYQEALDREQFIKSLIGRINTPEDAIKLGSESKFLAGKYINTGDSLSNLEWYRFIQDRKNRREIQKRKSGGVIFGHGMNSGGQLNGYGGGDRVPAMLEPGEFIINKQSSAKYGSLLQDINKDTLPGFKSGYTPGKFAGLNQRMGGAMTLSMNAMMVPMMLPMIEQTEGFTKALMIAVVAVQGFAAVLQLASMTAGGFGKLGAARGMASTAATGAQRFGVDAAGLVKSQGGGKLAQMSAASKAGQLKGFAKLGGMLSTALLNPITIGLAVVAAVGIGLWMVWQNRLDQLKREAASAYRESTEMAKVYNIELNKTGKALQDNAKYAKAYGTASKTMGRGQVEKDYAKAVDKQYTDLITNIKEASSEEQKRNQLAAVYSSLIAQNFTKKQAGEITAEIARQAKATASYAAISKTLESNINNVDDAISVMTASLENQMKMLKTSQERIEAIKTAYQNIVRISSKDPTAAVQGTADLVNTASAAGGLGSLITSELEGIAIDERNRNKIFENLFDGKAQNWSSKQGRKIGAAILLGIQYGLDPNELQTNSLDAIITKLGSMITLYDAKVNMNKTLEESNKKLEKSINKINKVYDKQAEALQKDKEAIIDGAEAKKKALEDEAKALQDRGDLIRDNAELYIKMLQKEYDAEQFYQKQREESINGLKSLAEGDIFGYLQSQKKAASDAQQFGREQAIKQIEDTRDTAIANIEAKLKLNQEAGDKLDDATQKALEGKDKQIEDVNTARSNLIKRIRDMIDRTTKIINDPNFTDVGKVQKFQKALKTLIGDLPKDAQKAFKEMNLKLGQTLILDTEQAGRIMHNVMGANIEGMSGWLNDKLGLTKTTGTATGQTTTTVTIAGDNNGTIDITNAKVKKNKSGDKVLDDVGATPPGAGNQYKGYTKKFAGYGNVDVFDASGKYVGTYPVTGKIGGNAMDPNTGYPVSQIPDKKNMGGKILKFGDGTGRMVPGFGNSDTVSALLTPGEFVSDRTATRRNFPVLQAMNAGATFTVPQLQSYNDTMGSENEVKNTSIDMPVNIVINGTNLSADELKKGIYSELMRAKNSLANTIGGLS